MDWMQVLAIVTGLAGQLLVARRNPAGFWCWVVGNMVLMRMFYDQGLWGMVVLYFVYTGISLYSIRAWQKRAAA